MDSISLHLSVDYLGSSGLVLSSEQKAALQTSLVILQNENKFNRVFLWGKILGLGGDYMVCQGVYRDELASRKTFYSQDCIHWGLLPPASAEIKARAKLARGRFTGNLSFEFEHVETRKSGDGEEEEEEEVITIKEEDRLAAVVAEIDQDVRIVPRAAYIQTPTKDVIKNRHFEGLSVLESAKLNNYFHFRAANNWSLSNLLKRANSDPAIDFLDSIQEDIPMGSWSIQFERGSGLVTLRSLLWPGYVFYHVPGTREYGSLYFGTGEKNLDLPFML